MRAPKTPSRTPSPTPSEILYVGFFMCFFRSLDFAVWASKPQTSAPGSIQFGSVDMRRPGKDPICPWDKPRISPSSVASFGPEVSRECPRGVSGPLRAPAPGVSKKCPESTPEPGARRAPETPACSRPGALQFFGTEEAQFAPGTNAAFAPGTNWG